MFQMGVLLGLWSSWKRTSKSCKVLALTPRWLQEADGWESPWTDTRCTLQFAGIPCPVLIHQGLVLFVEKFKVTQFFADVLLQKLFHC